MAKIDSPAADLAFDVPQNPSHSTGKGGTPAYPTQTPGPGPRIVERHNNDGSPTKPSNPRQGSRGTVSTPASDALIKTK